MARRPRLHIPGGFYHIILRGNGRQAIFFDADDRDRWEALLADGLHHYPHRVHAYCWMTNHVHLAVQAHAEPLSRFVAFVASRYARMTNRKNSRSGHLFERRYRAILVQADTHLLELVRYIHLNPVRAGIVPRPGEYRWSSHRAYLSANGPDWLTLDRVLSLLGPAVGKARLHYVRFMDAPADESLWQQLRTGRDDDPRILGDDDFARTADAQSARPARYGSLDDLIEDACQRHGVSERDLASHSRVRHHAQVRAEIGIAAVDGRVASLAEVARRFNRNSSGLCRGMNRLRTGARKGNK